MVLIIEGATEKALKWIYKIKLFLNIDLFLNNTQRLKEEIFFKIKLLLFLNICSVYLFGLPSIKLLLNYINYALVSQQHKHHYNYYITIITLH